VHVSEHAAAFSLVSKVDVEVTSSFDRVGRATRHQQGYRTAKAAAQFHVLGLCRDVLFYRPVRGCDTDRAIWDSHRAVAADHGPQSRVLAR
jgi:hypothetical protein